MAIYPPVADSIGIKTSWRATTPSTGLYYKFNGRLTQLLLSFLYWLFEEFVNPTQ